MKNKPKELKLWSVHLHSESGDDYYETFRCEEQPTDQMILRWWDKQEFHEEADYLNVMQVTEVSLSSPILKKNARSRKIPTEVAGL